MALQQKPHKEMAAQLSLDRPQVADSLFRQKSNLALRTSTTDSLFCEKQWGVLL